MYRCHGVEPDRLQESALIAGAALAALDALVRHDARWAGAWRQRLALQAAAQTARQMGRAEDEAAVRDAVLLTKAGDDVGPAGRLLLAWQRLAARPADELLAKESLAALIEAFGYAWDDATVEELVEAMKPPLAGYGLAGLPAHAFGAAAQCGFGPALGGWLADAALAQHLGWAHAVPLMGTTAPSGRAKRLRLPRVSLASSQNEAGEPGHTVSALLAAQAHAALRAIDLWAGLGRRADTLLGVVPRLRARAAGTVVEKLLDEDALVASEAITGMSERGLRRLFDRLVSLGALRELSGRSTFRIYGL